MTDESGIPTFGPAARPSPKAAVERAAKPDADRLRISDLERQEFIDQLTRHCADGRLTFDELDERIAGAWSARTQAELRPLAEDLPALAPARGPEPTLKAWLADGKALLMTLPARTLVAGAAGLVLVFMLLALLAVPFGGDGGFHH